jgi:serine phosphatase RsbU (regulator of sigma subunit)
MSDGIAEATDLNGNLFGFERVLDLLRNSASAAAIAAAAQNFGQEDDISVISITRTAASIAAGFVVPEKSAIRQGRLAH